MPWISVAPAVAAVGRRAPFAVPSWVVLAGYNLALGLVLIVGGPERVAGPSFVTIRELGGHLPWGSALVALGVLIAAATLVSRRLMSWAFAAGAAVHLFLCGGFVISAMADRRAALTGIVTYLAVSAWHGIHALVMRRTLALRGTGDR